jgi:hypothetical protein
MPVSCLPDVCSAMRCWVIRCAVTIEHRLGSGWIPEGQVKLFERLRAKGVSWVDYGHRTTRFGHAHRVSHRRFSRFTMHAKQIPCRLSKSRLPMRWYAPCAWVWQSAQSGTQE